MKQVYVINKVMRHQLLGAIVESVKVVDCSRSDVNKEVQRLNRSATKYHYYSKRVPMESK